ncbi:hypothetical protein D3C80_1495570 [compost metagenome]
MVGCHEHGRVDELSSKCRLFEQRQPSVFFEVAGKQNLEWPVLEECHHAQVVRVVKGWRRVPKRPHRDASHTLIEGDVHGVDVAGMNVQESFDVLGQFAAGLLDDPHDFG